MKKMGYILILGLFTLFIPRVYAFSYDININGDTSSVKVGTKKELKVSINNIQDTTDGVVTCSMNILFDKNIALDSSIKTLNSWSMMTGDMYLFDTGSPVFDSSEMFTIPVKVNGDGTIKLNNIVCSDGVEEIEISNKQFSLTVKNENVQESDDEDKKDNNDNRQDNDTEQEENNNDEDTNIMDSNCNLKELTISEGVIEFDPNVTEYEVKITNFDEFEVNPVLESISASYLIDKNLDGNKGNIVITVKAKDGSFKIYTIYTTISKDSTSDTKKGNNYVPIFIGIICVLVLINIFRIVGNMKRK